MARSFDRVGDRTASRRYQTPFGEARGMVPGGTGDHSFLDAPTDQDSTGRVALARGSMRPR